MRTTAEMKMKSLLYVVMLIFNICVFLIQGTKFVHIIVACCTEDSKNSADLDLLNLSVRSGTIFKFSHF